MLMGFRNRNYIYHKMSKEIRFNIPDGQAVKVSELLGLYGYKSVNQLARYFFEKGLEISSTRFDLHSQVDLMSKMVDAATQEFVTKEHLEEIDTKALEMTGAGTN